MNLNIPTNQALDRLLELFLDKLGVKDQIVNEDLIIEAFYAGAQGMSIIQELQMVEKEEEITAMVEEEFATVDEINAVLSEAVFDEANYAGGNC